MDEAISTFEARVFFAMMPNSCSRRAEFVRSDRSFVHYTSATNAINIIRNKQVWLRNALLMNDKSEIAHGHNCLISALKSISGIRLLEYLQIKIQKQFKSSSN